MSTYYNVLTTKTMNQSRKLFIFLMPSFSQSERAQAPDLVGAGVAQANAQAAQNPLNGILGAGADLGGAYLSANPFQGNKVTELEKQRLLAAITRSNRGYTGAANPTLANVGQQTANTGMTAGSRSGYATALDARTERENAEGSAK